MNDKSRIWFAVEPISKSSSPRTFEGPRVYVNERFSRDKFILTVQDAALLLHKQLGDRLD